jgi:NhaP-type Na+/H+ or K+/H+ antiporter
VKWHAIRSDPRMPDTLAATVAQAPAGMSALVYLTLVLALGVTAQWLAWRLRLPSILLLLAFGFGLGQVTGVRVDDFLASGDGQASPLLSVVGLFVAIILFEGGLTLKFRELREAGAPIFRLCTASVAISFALTTWFMAQVLGYDAWLAALTGAILTVTGPTVVAPLLRHVNPSRKMNSMIKWEGIVVDPIGAILAVLVFRAALAVDAEAAWVEVLIAIGKVVVIGVVGGFVLAKLVEVLLRRHLIPDYLQPVFLLAVVAVAFTLSNHFEKEAGLLTVTVLGITLANQRSISVKHILEFKENLRTLIISSLFIILSGRIGPEELRHSLSGGLALLAFIVVIGRPLSIFIALFGTDQTDYRERTFLAFLAPRGIVAAAVASIFALEFEAAAARGGHFGDNAARIAAQAADISTLIFLIIVGTVAVYGLTAVPLARALGLASKNPTGILFAGADPWARLAAATLQADGHQVMLLDTNYSNVSAAKLKGLEAHRANILSEFAEEELDFNGLGSLVAGTPNDEVNSIASQRFIHQFGRAGVWQLAPFDRHDSKKNTASHEVRSQICFTGGPDHATLSQLVDEGAVVKKSQITDIYTFEDFRLTYGDPSPPILFLADRSGELRPAPAELKQISPGTTVYFLVHPDAEPGDTRA